MALTQIKLGGLAAESVDSDAYVDGSIDLAHLSADSVDSTQYVDGSIDNAHLADDAADSDEIAAGAIDTAHIADNQVTLAKMAGGTDGNIISYDASGDPVAIATGSDGQVLTSTGAGSPPAFEAITSPAITAITGAAANQVLTDDGDGTVTSESGLTYDGTEVMITSTDAGAGAAPDLILYRNSSSPAAEDVMGSIKFKGENEGGGAIVLATIETVLSGVAVDNEFGRLKFSVENAGTMTETMNLRAGKVGIGTAAPAAHLDINTGGNASIFIGDKDGTSEMYIKSDNESHLWFETDTLDSGTTNKQWHLYNQKAASDRFEVRNGSTGAYIGTGDGSWSSIASDERLKTDWVMFDDALTKINSLTKIGTYKNLNPVTDEVGTKDHIGLSAQEIQAILPEAVSESVFKEYNDEKYLGLNYQSVFILMLKSIQELSAKVEALENA